MFNICLSSILCNSDNAREPAPRLQGYGYGIVEPVADSGKPSLFALALGSPDDKSKFIDLIDQHDEGLTILAQSIDSHGQLENCRVRPLGDGQYALTFGARRALAILYLHAKKSRPATIWATESQLDDKTAVMESAAENIHLPPSFIDQARLFKRLRDQEMTVADIAKVYPMGKSTEQNIRHRLRLLELPEEVQFKVHHGELSQQKALKILTNPRPVTKAVAVRPARRKPAVSNHDELQNTLQEFVKRLRWIALNYLPSDQHDEVQRLAGQAESLQEEIKKWSSTGEMAIAR